MSFPLKEVEKAFSNNHGKKREMEIMTERQAIWPRMLNQIHKVNVWSFGSSPVMILMDFQ